MNIIVKFAPQDHATINYTNCEGITADRKIQPLHIWFGTTEYHKTPQFLLNAIDLDKNVERDFAMNQIHNINVFYNPLSREEWYYHPLSPQKEFFFTYPAGVHSTVTIGNSPELLELLIKEGYTLTYRAGKCVIEKQEESPYNPQSQLPDFFLGDFSKNSESELVQEDYISGFNQRGTGSKVEKLPTVEEAREYCDNLVVRTLEKRVKKS